MATDGGRVVPSPLHEIEFRSSGGFPYEVIMLTETNQHDPLFTEMGERFRVFQLRRETVQLTPKLKQLVSGRLVKNQVVKLAIQYVRV